ncbi:MAG: hypothetical protein HZA88_09545 [Verrucomicrobia bacterium]|nr:hypothetical protein [Verrucomicrobiota bacterium]
MTPFLRACIALPLFTLLADAQIRPQFPPPSNTGGPIVSRIASSDSALVEKTWDQLSDKDLGTTGKSVVGDMRYWRHGETANFVIHFMNFRGVQIFSTAQKAGRVAEFYLAQLKLDFGLTQDLRKGKSHIFLVAGEADWSRFCAQHGLANFTRCVSEGSSIFYYTRWGEASLAQDMAFPVATCVLHRFFPKPLPFWLCVGVGEFETGNAYAKLKGYSNPGSRTPPGKADYPLSELITATAYPTDPRRPDERQRMAASCELIVRTLLTKLDPRRFVPLALKLGEGIRFDQALLETYPDRFKTYADFERFSGLPRDLVSLPPMRTRTPRTVAQQDPEQLKTFLAELRKQNPGFNGEMPWTRRENEQVVEIVLRVDDLVNLSPLRSLPALQKLTLWNSGTEAKSVDLTPLKGMKLAELTFSRTQAKDLSLLKNISCARLFFEVVTVSDLTFLRGMSLTAFGAEGSKISDLSPLSGMPLTELRLSQTLISDLSILKGLPLTELKVDGTQITDLSPLKGMKLTLLRIDNTKVSDISPLKDMKLTRLNIDNTKVSDLSPLKGMPLKTLSLQSTEVRDLSPLEGMELADLDAFNAKLSDLTALKGMPLTSLSLGRTKINDLSPLKGMPLESLTLSQTKVKDLTPLQGMSLNSLWINRTEVTDLSPLKGMPLKTLGFANTQVSDLTPLEGMRLMFIDCDAKLLRSSPVLRNCRTLQTINGRPAAQFWQQQ